MPEMSITHKNRRESYNSGNILFARQPQIHWIGAAKKDPASESSQNASGREVIPSYLQTKEGFLKTFSDRAHKVTTCNFLCPSENLNLLRKVILLVFFLCILRTDI